MQTIDLKLPYTEAALLLDALRHYIHHIDTLDENSIDDDSYADLLNDNENLKGIERHIAALLAQQAGPY